MRDLAYISGTVCNHITPISSGGGREVRAAMYSNTTSLDLEHRMPLCSSISLPPLFVGKHKVTNYLVP